MRADHELVLAGRHILKDVGITALPDNQWLEIEHEMQVPFAQPIGLARSSAAKTSRMPAGSKSGRLCERRRIASVNDSGVG